MINEIEREILSKMLSDRIIGERHTSEDNIPKGFPKHKRGDLKRALRKLIRKGYVIPKITGYGVEVSLNPRKIEEVKKLLAQ
jgi:hypothetical protein